MGLPISRLAVAVLVLSGSAGSSFSLDLPETAASASSAANARDLSGASYSEALKILNGAGENGERETEAAEQLRLAARLGHADAQYHLALAFNAGIGVVRDQNAARQLFESAARQGHVQSQFMLASAYTNARGVEKDHAWAARWYGKAADKGLVRAQYMMGLSFGAGLGVPVDREQALFWLLLAAKSGHKDSVALSKSLAADLPQDRVAAVRQRAGAWTPSPAAGGVDLPTVRFVQVTLEKLGFFVGRIDGVIGPQTRDALDRYGRSAGLEKPPELTEEFVTELRYVYRMRQSASIRGGLN